MYHDRHPHMQLLTLLFLSFEFNPHVFGYPMYIVGSEITHAALGGMGRGADEISHVATLGRSGLQGGNVANPPFTAAAGKQIPEIGDSLFGGRQGQTSKDASIFEKPPPVTNKHITDIFIREPSRPYSPPTYKQAVTGRTLYDKLKPVQIDQLQPEELVEYISNFNSEVKASKDSWRAADQEVKDAELTLSNNVFKEYRNKFPEDTHTTLRELFAEESTGVVKMPDGAEKRLQRLRANVERQAPTSSSPDVLNRIAIRLLAKELRVSTENVDIAIEEAKKAKDSAIQLAEMRKTSGYPFMDRMKIYSQKLAASIKNFAAKFKFKWPWRKSAAPDYLNQNQQVRPVMTPEQLAKLRASLRRGTTRSRSG